MPVMANVAKYLGFKEIAEARDMLIAGIINRSGNRLMNSAIPEIKDLGVAMFNFSNIMRPLMNPGFKSFDEYGRAAFRHMASYWWGNTSTLQKAARVGSIVGGGYAAYKGYKFVTGSRQPTWQRAELERYTK